jgi:hypothetical protein
MKYLTFTFLFNVWLNSLEIPTISPLNVSPSILYGNDPPHMFSSTCTAVEGGEEPNWSPSYGTVFIHLYTAVVVGGSLIELDRHFEEQYKWLWHQTFIENLKTLVLWVISLIKYLASTLSANVGLFTQTL